MFAECITTVDTVALVYITYQKQCFYSAKSTAFSVDAKGKVVVVCVCMAEGSGAGTDTLADTL